MRRTHLFVFSKKNILWKKIFEEKKLLCKKNFFFRILFFWIALSFPHSGHVKLWKLFYSSNSYGLKSWKLAFFRQTISLPNLAIFQRYFACSFPIERPSKCILLIPPILLGGVWTHPPPHPVARVQACTCNWQYNLKPRPPNYWAKII